MATLLELSDIAADSRWNDLLNKVKVAAAKKAVAIIDEPTSPVARLEWAKSAVINPNSAGHDVIWYVIAKNASTNLTQIFGATDDDIQVNVNASIDALYK